MKSCWLSKLHLLINPSALLVESASLMYRSTNVKTDPL
ncbi:hypothetical protein EV14_2237 [Prochlorococcus sp. MIT 0703]|nr:hypothetical protein EV12_1592 [Prochlorococcus sp. MIT 0701]KGG31446.1 hypothetical protein EV14_2237 [Prochlorococcus sp. MIT 0703]